MQIFGIATRTLIILKHGRAGALIASDLSFLVPAVFHPAAARWLICLKCFSCICRISFAYFSHGAPGIWRLYFDSWIWIHSKFWSHKCGCKFQSHVVYRCWDPHRKTWVAALSCRSDFCYINKICLYDGWITYLGAHIYRFTNLIKGDLIYSY